MLYHWSTLVHPFILAYCLCFYYHAPLRGKYKPKSTHKARALKRLHLSSTGVWVSLFSEGGFQLGLTSKVTENLCPRIYQKGHRKQCILF